MKAYVCREFGPVDSHKVEEVEDPRAEPGMVVIDVKAAGVSFPDVLIVQGKYQFQPPFPFSPGGEIAGVISEVGEGVADWKEGDRVIAMVGNGGIAEKTSAYAATLMPLPESMDFKDGAAFPLNYGTTYYALKQRGELKKGETLLVTGAGGGVGTTAIEIGKAMGARVIAAASNQEKLDIAKRLGADEVVNYGDGELKEKVKELSVYMDGPENLVIKKNQIKILNLINNSKKKINIKLIHQKKNYGLAHSVLNAVKTELKNNEAIILVEDDCVPQKGFFKYMNTSFLSSA